MIIYKERLTMDNLNLPERFTKALSASLKCLYQYRSVELVVLYGSCAKNEIKSTSDIDLMVISEEKLDSKSRSIIRGSVQELDLDVEVDVVFYSKNTFDNSDDIFTKNVRNDGIVLQKEDIVY